MLREPQRRPIFFLSGEAVGPSKAVLREFEPSKRDPDAPMP
jgi:hypothetical protein